MQIAIYYITLTFSEVVPALVAPFTSAHVSPVVVISPAIAGAVSAPAAVVSPVGTPGGKEVFSCRIDLFKAGLFFFNLPGAICNQFV